MIPRRKQASPEAEQKFAADQALAARFDDLLAEARSAEQEMRDAQAAQRSPRPSSTGGPSAWTRR